MSSWTEARVERLKRLHADGMSGAQIAAELGGVTRNAVIGKLHRIGLRTAGAPSQSPHRRVRSAEQHEGASRRRPRPSAPKLSIGAPHSEAQPAHDDFVPEPPKKNRGEVPLGARAAVVALTERCCRWPLGDPRAADFQFCCDPAVTGRPYCGRHHRVAFDRAATVRAASRSLPANATGAINV